MLSKNSDRFCQHPYFIMTSEPRVMSSAGPNKIGYNTMPLKYTRRAKSNYSVNRRNKKNRRRRLMTANNGVRKQSAANEVGRPHRPITAKGPGMGRFGHKNENTESPNDGNFRPETVPFTNIGPLGETEPADEDDRIKAEINREATGESDKDIEARIGNEETPNEEGKISNLKIIASKFFIFIITFFIKRFI